VSTALPVRQRKVFGQVLEFPDASVEAHDSCPLVDRLDACDGDHRAALPAAESVGCDDEVVGYRFTGREDRRLHVTEATVVGKGGETVTPCQRSPIQIEHSATTLRPILASCLRPYERRFHVRYRSVNNWSKSDRDELVAEFANGDDSGGMGGIAFELLP
jgi:hypothetical protein